MAKAKINPSNFEYLKQLKKHNNRDWFNKNKDRYLNELKELELFADDLLAMMNGHDKIETPTGKKSLFRIYKDVRFSKDKKPYKTHWSGHFKRATKALRGGYYFHIEQGNSFAAGGFWGPEPVDLKRVRDELAHDAAPLRNILKSKAFIKTFKKLDGDQVKTSPQGFDPKNPAIDLLRYKQYILVKKFSDKEVVSANFAKNLNETFKVMRPFLNYMSDVLTTDVNGISII